MINNSVSFKHQSGVVLPISMIMLLLLTLISITSSQVAGLEEKMAGNSKDLNLAFQAAEAALRVGEAATAGTPVFYPTSVPRTAIDWTHAAVTTYSGGTLSGISQAPVYVIESLPATASNAPGTGGSLQAGTPPDSTSNLWYRVTARGTGGTTNAVVILQSTYRR